MKRHSQSGFAVIEAVLVAIAICLVGFVGWFVWQANNKAYDTLDYASNSSTTIPAKTTAKQEKDKATGWIIYSSKNKEYTLALPDGFEFETPTGLEENTYLSLGAYDVKTPKPGTPAKVEPSRGGRDGVSGVSINYFKNASQISTPMGKQMAGFKTNSGLTVTAHYYLETEGEEGFVDSFAKGDKIYRYVVAKGDRALDIGYSVRAGDADHSAVFEKMVKTVELK